MVISINASSRPRANDSRKKPAEHWQKVSGKSSAICSKASVLWSFEQNMCRLTSPGNTWSKAGLRLVFPSTAGLPAASVYFCGVNILTSDTVAGGITTNFLCSLKKIYDVVCLGRQRQIFFCAAPFGYRALEIRIVKRDHLFRLGLCLLEVAQILTVISPRMTFCFHLGNQGSPQ